MVLIIAPAAEAILAEEPSDSLHDKFSIYDLKLAKSISLKSNDTLLLVLAKALMGLQQQTVTVFILLDRQFL